MLSRRPRFQDHVILITGASSGIGEAMAREFARQGAILALAARRRDRLDRLVQELKGSDTNALAITCDVTKDGDIESAVTQAVKRFGRLDVVVANAGFSVAGLFEQLTLDDYRRQFDTNVFGAIRTAYAGLNELKKTRGRLVLIGSVNGYLSAPGASAYCASKFALRGFAEALTPELRPSGVTVTLIGPGFVESEIRQLNHLGEMTNAKDPLPTWMVMSSAAAAKKIVEATARRRQEIVITAHGKIGVWVVRHAPWIVRLVYRLGYRWSTPASSTP